MVFLCFTHLTIPLASGEMLIQAAHADLVQNLLPEIGDLQLTVSCKGQSHCLVHMVLTPHWWQKRMHPACFADLRRPLRQSAHHLHAARRSNDWQLVAAPAELKPAALDNAAQRLEEFAGQLQKYHECCQLVVNRTRLMILHDYHQPQDADCSQLLFQNGWVLNDGSVAFPATLQAH